MKNAIKFFSPNFKLVRGARLTSALFIGASIALAAGIIFGANIYYDIDTSKIIVGDTQQATTTQISVNTANTTALTVTQRGSGAAFSATSTSAMTSDIFKITNLGSGLSFVIEDSDTDSSPFIVNNDGRVGIGTTTLAGLLTVGTSTPYLVVDPTGKTGIASSTPSEQLAVQGNIIGSGNIVVYGTAASSTFATPIQTTRMKITEGGPAANYLLTASDSLGNSEWKETSWITPSNWQFIGASALRPTTTVGIIVNASSTFSGDLTIGSTIYPSNPILFADFSEGRLGIGTTTLAGLFTVGTSTPYLVIDPTGKTGIASSTPSEQLAVQGNIIGSGNLVIYGTATTTIGGQISMAGTELKATGGDFTVFLSSTGSLSLQPQSNSDVKVILGGTGQLKVGSSGQFYIDASGNATTSGNIYATAFLSTGANAYTRKVGEEIVRGVVPVFGFDLPARCNTSCSSGTATATISRVIENDDDIFPAPYAGTTRKYRFSIRYADATTTATTRTTWDVATSSDRTYTDRFTLPPTDSTDLDKGFTTTTNQVTLPTTDDWFLRVSTGGIGGYDLQVYEILLIGLDQVN